MRICLLSSLSTTQCATQYETVDNWSIPDDVWNDVLEYTQILVTGGKIMVFDIEGHPII